MGHAPVWAASAGKVVLVARAVRGAMALAVTLLVAAAPEVRLVRKDPSAPKVPAAVWAVPDWLQSSERPRALASEFSQHARLRLQV